MERKSKGGNKTQNEKLQRDRRLWNGNTKSKQLVIKKANNQTATKPSTPPQFGDRNKTYRAVHPWKKCELMARLPMRKSKILPTENIN